MEGLTEERKVQLRERQTELIEIIKALDGLERNSDWQTLKTLVFEKTLSTIELQLKNESLAQTIDTSKIYRLQGEWAWARQYTNVVEFAENLKKQLASIKQMLK